MFLDVWLFRWNADRFKAIMTRPDLPLWTNLSRNGIDPDRHIRYLFTLYSPELRKRFDNAIVNAFFLGREYVFEYEEKAFSVIIEVAPYALYKLCETELSQM